MAYSGLTMGSLTDSVNKAYSPRGDAARRQMQFQGAPKEGGFLKGLASTGGKLAEIYGTATGNPIVAGLGNLASSYGSDTGIDKSVVAAGLGAAFDQYATPSSSPASMASGSESILSGLTPLSGTYGSLS